MRGLPATQRSGEERGRQKCFGNRHYRSEAIYSNPEAETHAEAPSEAPQHTHRQRPSASRAAPASADTLCAARHASLSMWTVTGDGAWVLKPGRLPTPWEIRASFTQAQWLSEPGLDTVESPGPAGLFLESSNPLVTSHSMPSFKCFLNKLFHHW